MNCSTQVSSKTSGLLWLLRKSAAFFILYPPWSDANLSNTCNKYHMSTGCCPKPLAITSRVMLPESSLALMNISHLRCGPVGVRFIESRFAGRHKRRLYKDLKRKFLYYPVTNLEQPHCVNCIWATACQGLTPSLPSFLITTAWAFAPKNCVWGSSPPLTPSES